MRQLNVAGKLFSLCIALLSMKCVENKASENGRKLKL
jgi:hypothetical protein